MKVSLLLCVCLFATSTQVAGCGAPAELTEPAPAQTTGAPENDRLSARGGTPAEAAEAADAPESVTNADCSDPCAIPTSCGQICLTLKGRGSSCQLLPTVNDLTRPPLGVRFDCSPLSHGPNGYDFDALGHITLMGDTCDALQASGPHHVSLILSCPPS